MMAGSYDGLYTLEPDLFGRPYLEFQHFIERNLFKGARTLDLGAGQGRDSLMMARLGLDVTAVDISTVGLEQMMKTAKIEGLTLKVEALDIFLYPMYKQYDLIVMDSILHFSNSTKEKELHLLDRVVKQIDQEGFIAIFLHKSKSKEKVLKSWYKRIEGFTISSEGYIDYTYKEKHTGFSSSFEYFMFIIQKVALATK